MDRGSKYLGIAYRNRRSDMVIPVGYLMNDESLLFHLGGILQRYAITDLVVGFPKQHKEAQKAIKELIQQMLLMNEDLDVHLVDEEYSSVVAGAKKDSFQKDEQEDTLVAMLLLEHRKTKSSK